AVGAQGLLGRECGLAQWAQAAAARGQRVRAGGGRPGRPARACRCNTRAAGDGGYTARRRARRDQGAGADALDHGARVPAPMIDTTETMETTMRSQLQATTIHAATRRELLRGSGVLFAWAFVPRLARAEGRDPRFLTIVLRGGLDGLAAVAPVGDPDWIKLRGSNALTLEGQKPGLPLDGFFALNPAMPNVHRLYQAGHATIVHAAATPYRERSHFDGQDMLESGLPKPGPVDSGWLNRALAGLAPSPDAIASHRKAFAVGPITPLVVRGAAPVLSWVPPRLAPVSDETTLRVLDLYRHTDPTSAQGLEEGLGAAIVAKAGGVSEARPDVPDITGAGGIEQVRAYFAEA